MQCENGLFGRSDLIPLASSQILSDTSLGLGAADDGDHFYPSHIYPDKSLPGKMSTRTNVYQHTYIPGQVSARTNVYPGKCLTGHIYLDKCLPRHLARDPLTPKMFSLNLTPIPKRSQKHLSRYKFFWEEFWTASRYILCFSVLVTKATVSKCN